ncbi:MAG: DEAD/DEAH box helicase [Planctomycetes bacterium]|nr:DEAD/DEAH box helicase [Planctomycetota bacterium]
MLPTFHPTVARWFRDRLGAPSPPQVAGWPRIAAGEHVLIAAPTGSGKTLAAFLHSLDALLQKGAALRDELHVVYVSPLRALANDVQKNLQQPLAELRSLDPSLPEVRVTVRSGDTPANERAAMTRTPPHILVTTPESLYILLTTMRGRKMLATARTLIVDEIHALAGSKRGSHFALTCERLDLLVRQHGGNLQRIGLSATQRPIEATAGLLAGTDRPCTIVDIGHSRAMDLEVEVPGAPLDTICSGEIWNEVFARMSALIAGHRTTLVFANTRKMAERVAARLADVVGKDLVTSHHGSLSKARRLDAEQRLKHGQLKALVATSSLELGIDIGDVDLVLQIGPTPSIAAFLQRIGRAGHGIGRLPKGRLFPLTRDELLASAGLLFAVRHGDLDRTTQPLHPLDILAQQVVAACCDDTFVEDELFAAVRRAFPFRELSRDRFDAVLAMHAGGRAALLHRDSIHRTVRSTRRARLTAVTCGGAIPDVADWQVVLDHDDTPVGTVHEDFAIESSVGDVFQLGTTSWQIRRIGSGQLRVADAHGVPPSLPFWIAEGPSRSDELCAAIARVRVHGTSNEWLQQECGLRPAAADQLAEYLRSGAEALGAMPSRDQLVLERFFDETGGQQLILHSPFGSRINRARGLALRNRFCVGFGYELQAAANEDALLISLGPMHSFELGDVWNYLHPDTAKDVLVQSMLPAPMFQARWRWNVARSLLVERFRSGRKVPAPLLRFRADDALAAAFPQAQACPETLPPGPIEVPEDHPVVGQTVHDTLHEAMDLDGMLTLLARIRGGTIGLREVDHSGPSPFAESILHAMPYSFLDDAPLEERRTQAVTSAQRGARRTAASHDAASELDPDAVEQVQGECWPDPRSAAELHEALGWMGWLHEGEVEPAWREWLATLAADGRALRDGDRWFAAEASHERLAGWRGRLEAVIPVQADQLPFEDQEALRALEAEGTAMRARLAGREVWAHRRLLARVRNRMLDRLRAAVQPVSQAVFAEFLAGWQGQTEPTRRTGPRGLHETLVQWASAAFPVEAWEYDVLPPRIADYRREWLDQATLSGEFAWLRLWGPWRGPLSRLPLSIVPRQDLALWLELPLERAQPPELGAAARTLHELLARRGALFPTDLQTQSRLLPSHLEEGLGELVGSGLATCDSFATIRQLAIAPSQRAFPLFAVGRWSLLPLPPNDTRASDAAIELCARSLLARFGVVSHPLLLAEKVPVPWRLLLRTLRAMELRGDVRGGRFVTGWAGEQYARPEAVVGLRRARRQSDEADRGCDQVADATVRP